MFKTLLENVGMNSDSSMNDLALLLSEETDEFANTFDELITPEADDPIVDDTDDDSVLATVGSEVAADAIEQIGDVSDTDSIVDTVIVDDDGNDETDDIIDATNNISSDDIEDVIVDDDDEDDDDSIIIDDNSADTSDDEIDLDNIDMTDIDSDDIISGAFSDGDAIGMDGKFDDIEDVIDDVEDLVESVVSSL